MKVLDNKSKIVTVCIIFLLILAIPVSGWTLVSFETLEPIRLTGSNPTDLTVSADGTIYSIDASSNRIIVHNFTNQYVGALPVALPIAVAVDNSTLYVGSGHDLSVKILNLSGQTIGLLGKGANEFKLPKNICIDSINKNIYVVDQLAHAIKIYSRDGKYLRQIDDSPNLPIDITMVGSEIFVLDQPLLSDQDGNQKRGSRIQVFDMHGSALRSFGSATEGQDDGFLRPKSITSDANGVIYVTDSYYGAVLCFDTAGNFLQLIEDPATSGTGSVGVAIDDTGKLLVSSPLQGRMTIFQISEKSIVSQDDLVTTTDSYPFSEADSAPVTDQEFFSPETTVPAQSDNSTAGLSANTNVSMGSQGTTLYIAMVDDSENDPFYNILSVQNLAQIEHTIRLLAYDPDGALVATLDKQLPATGSVRLRPAGKGTDWHTAGNSITGMSSFHGSVIIESSQPVAATTLFSANTGAFSIIESGKPMQTMIFPHIDDNLLEWQAELAIQNIHDSRQSVTITVYDHQGRMAGSEIMVMGAHSLYEMQPSSILGSKWMTTHNNGERSISGTIEVICNNDPLVAQVSYRQGSPLYGMTIFSGLESSTEIYLPILNDMVGDYPENAGPFNDIILTSNTVQTATYELFSYDGHGAGNPGQLTFSAANQTIYLSPAQLAGLAPGDSFNGVMRIKASHPLIAMNQIQHLGDAKVPGASSFAIEFSSQPDTEFYFPEVFDGALGWASFISIQNTTGTSHPVTIDTFREDGTNYSFSATVPANGAYLFSPGETKAAGLQGISGYFQGAIAISSTQPVAAALQYGHAPDPNYPDRMDNLEIYNGVSR